MRGDVLPVERCAAFPRCGDVLAHEALDGVATQRPASRRWEDGLLLVTSRLLAKPRVEDASDVVAKRSAARFPPFALTANMGAGAKHHVLAAQPNQLGHPESRLNGKEQERAVSAANPRGGIRSGKKRLDFLRCEELDWPTLEPLVGNGEHPLAEQRVCRLGQRDVLEEAVKGRQARVAGAGAVPALFFEVVEELGHERRVDVFDVEARGRLVQTRGREPQQEPEGVAVRTDGVRAGLSLPNEAVDEEALEKRLKSHDRTSGRDF